MSVRLTENDWERLIELGRREVKPKRIRREPGKWKPRAGMIEVTTLERRMIEVYDDDARRDWMRAQLRAWAARRQK